MYPHRNLFSQYPLVQIAISFCVGVCTVEYGPPLRLVFLGVAGGLLSLGALVALWKGWLKPAAWALLATMFFAGAALAVQVRRPLNRAVVGEGRTLILTGMLDGQPEFARDRLYFTLRVEHGSKARLVSLLAPFQNEVSEREFRCSVVR